MKRKQARMKSYVLTIIIEKDEDGYFISCPALQGCYSQGDTYEEAMENIRDAIKLHIEDRLEGGEQIVEPDSVTVGAIEIRIWVQNPQE